MSHSQQNTPALASESDPTNTVGNSEQPEAIFAPLDGDNLSGDRSIKSQGFGPVLQNKRFLLLWFGQIFSQIADKIYLVFMVALIAERFQSDNQPISGWVSAVMIAFTIPAVLFGSLAGVYVDRWSKKQVLVLTNLWRGLFVLSLPLLFAVFTGTTSLTGFLASIELPTGFLILLVITFGVSTLTQFFAPAEQSAIPLVVKHGNLLPANSLYTTTMMVALIIGFAVGEPLLALAEHLFPDNLPWQFGKEIVVGGAYLIAGIILLLLRTGEKPQDLRPSETHVFADIKDGFQYLQRNIRVRNALIQLTILFCIFAALSVLAVRLAELLPGIKAEQFGILLAVGGVGMAAGAAFLGQWGQKFPRIQLSAGGALGMAIALVSMAFSTQSLVLALLSTAFLGTCAAFVGVPMQTTIQAETPPNMRGKVFGLQNNAVNIALSLPLALAGIAETLFGLTSVMLGLALMAIAGGGLSYWLDRMDSR